MFNPKAGQQAPDPSKAGYTATASKPVNTGLPKANTPTPKSASGKSRIDPSQIPRPVKPADDAGTRKLQKPKNEATDSTHDAMSATPEQANAAPTFMRMTFNLIGNEASVASGTAIPLGLILNPLNPYGPAEEQIGCVDGNSTTGVMRCEKCRAYINPFMRFTDNGHKVICNFCNHLNQVHQDYFCGLDADGRRYDVADRPELRNGSVEFVAPQQFTNRPPQEPIYAFLLDVSYYSVTLTPSLTLTPSITLTSTLTLTLTLTILDILLTLTLSIVSGLNQYAQNVAPNPNPNPNWRSRLVCSKCGSP